MNKNEEDFDSLKHVGWINHDGSYTPEGVRIFKKTLEENIEESNTLQLVIKIQKTMEKKAADLINYL